MEKRCLTIILILIVLSNLAGCASALARHDGAGIYPGVREDIDTLQHPSGIMFGGPLWNSVVIMFSLLDLPLSFIMDTLLLPYDAAHANKQKEPKNNSESTNTIKEPDSNKVNAEKLNSPSVNMGD